MTDKASIEIESPASGILAGVTAKPDDVIPVTEVIAHILEPGEELPARLPRRLPRWPLSSRKPPLRPSRCKLVSLTSDGSCNTWP